MGLVRILCLVDPENTHIIDVTAQIISGFISFGSLHIRTTGFEPWQWFEHVRRLSYIMSTDFPLG